MREAREEHLKTLQVFDTCGVCHSCAGFSLVVLKSCLLCFTRKPLCPGPDNQLAGVAVVGDLKRVLLRSIEQIVILSI